LKLYTEENTASTATARRPLYTGVSIIIPVHNGDWVANAFETIFRNTQKYELIIIDNGSDERTAEYLMTLAGYGKIKLIQNNKNLGFAKACNQGAKEANYELLLFLNDDVLCYENWLDILVSGMYLKDLDACSPKGGIFNNELKGIGETTENDFDYLVGWCLMIKKEVFNRVHGFDEQYEFAFCEDSDLSFKLRAKGYNIGIVESNIVHLGNKTVNTQKTFSVNDIDERNRTRFKRKWFGDNIYMRRAGARGDVLMMTPFIREIKQKYPKRKLNFITLPDCAEVLENNPYIDKLITDIGENSDNTWDLNYERNSDRNRMEVIEEQLGIKLKDRSYDLMISEKEKRSVNKKLKKIKGPFVVFHTGKTWANREWDLRGFKTLGIWLIVKGYKIVEIGNRATARLGFNFLADKLSMKESAEVIRRSEFFVGIDSLGMHLATAMKKRSFVLYGVIEPMIVKTNPNETSFYVKGLSCRNCKNFGTLHCDYNIICMSIPYNTVKTEIDNYLTNGEVRSYVSI
jgi:GT2 family glycosyltransferase